MKLLNHSLSAVKLSNSDELNGLPEHRQSMGLEIYKKLKLLRSPSKTQRECVMSLSLDVDVESGFDSDAEDVISTAGALVVVTV